MGRASERPRRQAVRAAALQTAGDLPGAPDDRALYSADGSAMWLEPSAVRGTLAAGPFHLRHVLLFVLATVLLSPAMAFSFFDAWNPIFFISKMIKRFGLRKT